jgi:phosphoribosylamine--glycine ligase
VRFGDPEAQVLIPRLDSDLLELLEATARGRLAGVVPRWRPEPCVTVVMATAGYPGRFERGSEIRRVENLDAPGLTVFHAGTRRDGDRLIANGGRVLDVTALGPTIVAARDRAYAAVAAIDWPQGFYRRDIGWRAIGRPNS